MGNDSKLFINTGIIKSLIVVIVFVAVLAVLLFGNVFFERELANKDKVNIVFSAAEGTEYDSPTGLRIEVKSISEEIEAELRLDAEIFAEPEQDGIINVHGNYDIEIYSGQDLAEHPEVKLSFTVPSGLDAKDALVLYKGLEGYGLPGGSVEVKDREIILEVAELSSFVMAFPHDHSNIIPLIREPEEAALTDEGHAEVIVKIEAAEPLILGFGSSPWFSLEASLGLNQLSVETPDDWIFNQFTPRKSFLGPKEKKDMVCTFYGTGGDSILALSASSWDAMVMTWIDALHRLSTGDPLPWPVGPELLEESYELAVLMDLYEHIQDDSHHLEEEWRGAATFANANKVGRFLWETSMGWATARGTDFLVDILGNVWWRFLRTADLFVSQVVYALAGESEHFHSFYVYTSPELRIEPEQGEITAGESFQLEATLENPDGKLLSVPEVGWEVSGGGRIDSKGLLNSDDNADGECMVTASVRNVIDHRGDRQTLEKSAIIAIGGPETILTDDESRRVAEVEQVVVAVDVLRLRSGPSTDYDILDRLLSDTVLNVVGHHNDWLEVNTPDGKYGWVHGDYVIYIEGESKHVERASLIERLENDKVLPILDMTKQEVIDLLGEPDTEGWWAGPFIHYEDARSLIGNNNAGITNQKSLMIRHDGSGNIAEVNLSALHHVEIGMTFVEAMDKLGQELEIHDLEYGEFGNYLMLFSLAGYDFMFFSHDSADDPIIDIFVRKQD